MVSETSSSSIRFKVDNHLGSFGLMKRTRGISKADASTVSAPGYCIKACFSSSQNSVNMLLKILSRSIFQLGSRGKDREFAILIARSMATQQSNLEYRNFFLPPRTSQMPSSAWSQFLDNHSTC